MTMRSAPSAAAVSRIASPMAASVASTRASADTPSHVNLPGMSQQRQGVCGGPRRAAAVVPGHQDVFADDIEAPEMGHDQRRAGIAQQHLFDEALVLARRGAGGIGLADD